MSIMRQFLNLDNDANEDKENADGNDVYGEREAFARKEPEGWSQWPATHHNQEGDLVWKKRRIGKVYLVNVLFGKC